MRGGARRMSGGAKTATPTPARRPGQRPCGAPLAQPCTVARASGWPRPSSLTSHPRSCPADACRSAQVLHGLRTVIQRADERTGRYVTSQAE